MANFIDTQELRSGSLENPQTPLSFPAEWLLDIFNGGRTDSGIRVSELTALQASTVLACVGIICKAVASLPLHVYHVETKEGRTAKYLAEDHDLYQMLHRLPNKEMTSHTLRAAVMLHMLLWGNGYIEVQRNQAGDIIGLWPRNPARTRPVRTLNRITTVQGENVPPFTLCFQTAEGFADQLVDTTGSSSGTSENTGDGRYRYILAKNMLHLPGLSLDGRLGQPTVQLCRQTVGLALASEKYAAKFFGQGAVPIGLLEIPEALEPRAMEELRRQWIEAYGGENSNKTAVLEKGMKFTKIAFDPEQGQLSQLRLHQVSEIAAIFQVPQHMLPTGNSGNPSGSRLNLEQQGIDFVNLCLWPWLDIWQQEIDRKLLSKSRGRNFEAIFETRRLRMPDAASRSQFYATGSEMGFLCPNDIRDFEHLPPIRSAWAEKFGRPNTFAVRTDNPAPALPAQQSSRAFIHLVKDALVRATTRKKPTLGSYTRIFEPIMETILTANGKETRDLSNNTQVQAAISELYQRWGQYRGNITDDQVAEETARLVRSLTGVSYVL